VADIGRVAASDHERVHVIRLEMADILLYLVRLVDRLGVDLAASAFDKIAINAKKYPVALAKGLAKKYTELWRTSSDGLNRDLRHRGIASIVRD
jgi:hypothetical protein